MARKRRGNGVNVSMARKKSTVEPGRGSFGSQKRNLELRNRDSRFCEGIVRTEKGTIGLGNRGPLRKTKRSVWEITGPDNIITESGRGTIGPHRLILGRKG